jgi:DNA-binding transcriptional regulator YiaG
MMAFTRKDIQYIRGKGEWSVNIFASILGVAPNTVYRWEREPKDPKAEAEARLPAIESMQASILTLIDQTPLTKAQGQEIENATLVHGGLRGLYTLLRLHYERPERQERTSRVSRVAPGERRAAPAEVEAPVTDGESQD